MKSKRIGENRTKEIVDAIFRIARIYRDEEACQSHLATPHFLRHKTGTPHGIESLRLAPMRPLAPSLFPDVFRKTP